MSHSDRIVIDLFHLEPSPGQNIVNDILLAVERKLSNVSISTNYTKMVKMVNNIIAKHQHLSIL